MAEQLTKKCAHCGCIKQKEQFGKNNQQKSGLSCYCKECVNKYCAIYREKNRKKLRAAYKGVALKHKLKKFGLTFEEYCDLLVEQKNCCAICGIEQTKLNRLFDLDHNHKTGKIRGLVCRKCNHLIGLSRENFLIINSLKRYLKKYNGG